MSLTANLSLLSFSHQMLLSSALAVLLGGASLSVTKPEPSKNLPVVLNGRQAAQRVVYVVHPEYPAIAKVNYIQGDVVLRIIVDREGHVGEIHVLSGEPLLAAAAIKAVQGWRYQPYMESDNAIPFRTEVRVRFVLRFRKVGQAPQDPEKYLNSQIEPPQVADRPGENTSAQSVRLKVLVGPEGQILDAVPAGPEVSSIEDARQNIRRWKFKPARWGALRVPWYLIVDVPIVRSFTHR